MGRLHGVLCPLNAAGFLEDLGRMAERLAGIGVFVLGYRGDVVRQNILDSTENELAAHEHEAVVEVARIVVGTYGYALLVDDSARVYLVVKEEGGHAALGIAMDDGPVDGRGTAVLRQERGMEVERAQTRHGPNDLGQHAEGYHDLQVGLQGAQFLEESRVFQLLGLEDGDALTDGILLDGRSLQLRVMTANGLIGHSDDTHHIVAAFNEAAKRLNRKVGGAHVNDSHIYI